MQGEQRREKIKKILMTALEPVTGAALAKVFSVSRQVIVQDIAILRASGENILATPQGYLIPMRDNRQTVTYACRHDREKMAQELAIIIDHGGKVLDVIVEHPVYGELKGLLMLQSRHDLQQFLLNVEKSRAELLSALTQGIHLHTVEVPDAARAESIAQALDAAGILLKKSC